MEYQATEETVNGRLVVTVYYDPEKEDDYLKAKDWAHLKYGWAITILYEPIRGDEKCR